MNSHHYFCQACVRTKTCPMCTEWAELPLLLCNSFSNDTATQVLCLCIGIRRRARKQLRSIAYTGVLPDTLDSMTLQRWFQDTRQSPSSTGGPDFPRPITLLFCNQGTIEKCWHPLGFHILRCSTICVATPLSLVRTTFWFCFAILISMQRQESGFYVYPSLASICGFGYLFPYL